MATPITEITSSSVGRGATAARAVTTVSIAGRHAARALVGPVDPARAFVTTRTGGRAPAREARRAFGELGPTYVKLAQLIASSPGLFPEVLSDELRSLLDRVPPVPPADVEHVVRRELGRRPGRSIRSVRSDPAGVRLDRAGPHRHAPRRHRRGGQGATPRDPGPRRRRPSHPVRRGPATRAHRPRGDGWRTRLPSSRTSRRRSLTSSTSCSKAERWSGSPRTSMCSGANEGVRVPQVYWRYTTPRVLTMERIYGHSIDDTGALAGHRLRPSPSC